jgi:uncharacterized protein
MATTYKTPGVYIEEIAKFPPSVAQVETAIPVFIGYTQRRGVQGTPLPTATINAIVVSEAQRITSLMEYETYFGTGPNETLTINVEDTMSGATLAKRVISATVGSPSIHTMYYHMQLYFANGGGPCYVVAVGDTSAGSVSKTNLLAGLEMANRYDEPTLLVFPQAVSLATAGDMYDVYDDALAKCEILKDRFVIMDCHGDNTATLRDGATGIGINNLKYGAAYHPFLKSSLNYLYDLDNASVLQKVDINGDGDFADAGETPGAGTAYKALTSTQLQQQIKLEVEKLRVTLPPCSAVVGAYAFVDSTRGVWKAPANVSLAQVNGLTKYINDADQGDLNVDPTAGKSINVIRAFTGKGILIWGSRTLAGNDNEWRYVPVRRFFNMVEESIKKATGQFVFEPNDANTWTRVRAMIYNYLTTLWRQGALAGEKPEHAFYVECGLGKTMSALDILEGRMIVEIGMAAVRPAEFIILRFSHKMQES